MTGTRPWLAHYDEGVPASIDYQRLTVVEALQRSAAEHGGETALLFAGARLSYAELLAQVERMASTLAGLGLGPGGRLALHLPNLPQTAVAYYAALALGAQVVMSNPVYTDEELVPQWNDAGVRIAVVADWIWADRIPRLRDRLPIRHWIVASIPDALPAWKRWPARRALARRTPPRVADLSAVPGTLGWRDALARGERRPLPAPPAWDSIAVLQYTGGTTGAARGAMLLHSNLACQVQQIDAWLGGLPRGRETFLAALPLFHVFGMMVCLNLPVWTSAAIVLQPDPRDTAALLEDIGRHRVSILALVPAIFHAITHFPGVERYDLKSIKACLSGSAPLSVETLQRFEELTGGRIFEGYGLTETTAATHVNPLRGLRKIGSVGVPLPDTDARVVDPESGAPMPPGEPGELLVRGPQVMAGYWSAPEQSASALRDGWLATGDLATCDEDGYFRIVGRKKDLINSGGYKVFPDEVDQALARHPAVLESATIGVPDARRGETVKSFVVLRPGSAATEQELVAHCREQLAPYKVPREIEMRASLPRSSVLKVLRRTLLAEELERRKAAP